MVVVSWRMVSASTTGALLLLLLVLPDVLRMRGGTVAVDTSLFSEGEEGALSTVVVAQGARSRTALNFSLISAAKVGFMLDGDCKQSYRNQNTMVCEKGGVLDGFRKIPVFTICLKHVQLLSCGSSVDHPSVCNLFVYLTSVLYVARYFWIHSKAVVM